MANGLKKIFAIRMVISSWPCVLLEPKFWITLTILPWEKVTENKWLLVKYCICVCGGGDGGGLLLLIREHCFEKNQFKSSAFSKKIVTNLLSQKSGGIRGIFFV